MAQTRTAKRIGISVAQSKWTLPMGFLLATLVGLWWMRTASHPFQPLIIMLVLLMAAMVSSVAGFAFSAIAGAVLYHLVPSPIEAVKIMITCSIAIQMYSVIHLWKQIQWGRLVPFLLGAAMTLIPSAMLLVSISPGKWLLTIGILLAVLGLYMLLRKPIALNMNARNLRGFDFFFGALGGLMGPLAAMPGPPVTIWCSVQGMDKVEQRAIYQPYILIVQIAGLGAIWLVDHTKGVHFSGMMWMLPAILGCHLGLLIFERLNDRRFHLMIYTLLLISGLSMVAKYI